MLHDETWYAYFYCPSLNTGIFLEYLKNSTPVDRNPKYKSTCIRLIRIKLDMHLLLDLLHRFFLFPRILKMHLPSPVD